MPSFTQLFALAACAMVTFAASVPAAVHGHCDNAKLVHNTPIEVDGITISFTGFSCAPKKTASRDILRRTSSPTNVCGEICTNGCNDNAGNLPPVVDDCNRIKNAVVVLESQISPTFTTPAYGLQSLNFQTCTLFFQNTDSQPLESCWSSFTTAASQAGAGCFPPVQPFFSEGTCTASDGTWLVGAAHSAS